VIPARLVRWLGWVGFAGLLAIWFAIRVIGDRVWWTVPLLFGPRWLLGGAWLLMLPWMATDFRRAVMPAAVGLVVVVFPIMGATLGWHRARNGTGLPFRVYELNADGAAGYRHFDLITAQLTAMRPDLVIVAECGPELKSAFRSVAGYQLQVAHVDLCLLSRGPILEWSERDPMEFWKAYGAGAIVRAVVQGPAGPLRIGLVHLATPRSALQMYFDLSEIPKQGPLTRANIAEREAESLAARQWIFSGDSMPTVVAGDFNLPIESAIFRRHWGDLRDAFSRAGIGTGYTKHTSHWGVRIDHILTTSEIGAHRAFVGSDVGSDHLPLIADLVLPAQRTSTAR